MSEFPQVKPFTDEWYVLQFLRDWTAQDIETAIKKNVDLAQLMNANPGEAESVRGVLENHDVNAPWVTVGNTLYWFSVRRPDLYEAITNTEGGVEWITKSVEKMKTFLG